MNRKRLSITLVIVLIALALLGYAMAQQTFSGDSSAPQATVAPTATPATTGQTEAEAETEAEATPQPTLYPAESYLRVTTSTRVFEPIPLLEDGSLRLTQGEGVENIIHVGHNSVYMESSTCDNQDCVQQGEITLDNRDSRILYNMIICLPNQVSLELLTAEEAQTAWEEIYGAQ